MLTGRYEPEQTESFVNHVRPGDTVLDVGAHAGYYTLLASRLVGAEGRVWAFEPEPRNVRYLRGNVEANGRANVRVEPSAVSDVEGSARFGAGTGSGTGRLTAGGEHEVRTVTLDGVCEREGLVPTALKVDVEGAEERVFRGADETLRSARPVIFLSTHGPELRRACLDRLERAGYRTRAFGGEGEGDPADFLCLPDDG